MNLISIPPGPGFLDRVAAAWLAEAGDDPLAVADGLILFPTRRAARAAADAFLRAGGGRPMLLPRLLGVGALEDAPPVLAAAAGMPPPVDHAARLAALTRLVAEYGRSTGGARQVDQAWLLAGDLAALMDEAELAGVDLARALPDLVEEPFARHWQLTLRFLRIVMQAWPEWLAENGSSNPAAHRVALLAAQAAAWRDDPPAHRVWAAGFSTGAAHVRPLLRAIARLPRGQVILAGLDRGLTNDAWDVLPATPQHPQAGIATLLEGLGATRADVRDWPDAAPSARAALLSLALAPAGGLEAWRTQTVPRPDDLFLLEPADPQEEAVAVALVLRDAIGTAGATAALVTPDRALATRVAAELRRFGVVADDSAGEPLSGTPPAVFLRLLAGVVAARLAPVPLLALLKHPLLALGWPAQTARAAARDLELAALRGPRPGPGLAGLRRELTGSERPAVALLARLENALAPLLRATASVAADAGALLEALVESAEACAATDTLAGPERLWASEAGASLAAHLAALRPCLGTLPDLPPARLPVLLDAWLADTPALRTRRALRGQPGSEHPRVFIWGLLEARLQSADTVVLGGLAEGVWPPATDPGPWMGRPMRARAGLASPEDRVGQAAHDFVQTAAAARVAVLSCVRRREGAPVVPARWIARLEALLTAAHGQGLPRHSALAWARALDQPARVVPVPPPRPCPPARLRPRQLSVTEIETWQRDPFAIHARHVLRLRPLDPLDQPADAAEIGSLIHDGLSRFLARHGLDLPPDPAPALLTALEQALECASLRPALAAWWRPRLRRIADWVATTELARRKPGSRSAIGAELAGRWSVTPGFTLTGRADRVERLSGSGGLVLLDYKTGRVPPVKEVEAGQAPQLPLEAAMLAQGAFGPEFSGTVTTLGYWRLTGGPEPGEDLCLADDAETVRAWADGAAQGLRALVRRYAAEATPYLAQPHPGLVPRFPAYGRLARQAEWEAADE